MIEKYGEKVGEKAAMLMGLKLLDVDGKGRGQLQLHAPGDPYNQQNCLSLWCSEGGSPGVFRENARFEYSGYSGRVFSWSENDYFSKVDENNFHKATRS